ncbi:MAG TPA: hypothetical protein VF787_18325 [Thermoanaerobaculia bacterium]
MRKPDLLETMSEDELRQHIVDTGDDFQSAQFLLHQKALRRQERFNLVVTIATVIMAIQALVSLVALFSKT